MAPRSSRSPTRLFPIPTANSSKRTISGSPSSTTPAAAFGIGWTSECLRELLEQFSADRTGFNPEVAAIVPMQARYVIGPDDIIAYADIDDIIAYAYINVDYRSEPELSAVLLVLQRLHNA